MVVRERGPGTLRHTQKCTHRNAHADTDTQTKTKTHARARAKQHTQTLLCHVQHGKGGFDICRGLKWQRITLVRCCTREEEEEKTPGGGRATQSTASCETEEHATRHIMGSCHASQTDCLQLLCREEGKLACAGDLCHRTNPPRVAAPLSVNQKHETERGRGRERG